MISRVSKLLLDLLRDRRKTIVIEDQSTRVETDLSIAREKPDFLQVVQDLQQLMLSQMKSEDQNPPVYIELGAEVLPMSLRSSHIKSTDIVESSHLDGVLDATNLDLPNNSIDGLFLQNTFHHIPDPDAFFRECGRVLKPGGRVVILDPFFNLLSTRLYRILFRSESFDKNGSWNDASEHAMIGANQALSYIVFKRDRKRYDSMNPNLKIVKNFPVSSGLRYLLTGGLNFRRISPRWLFPLIKKCEGNRFLATSFAIHWIVVLEKV
jgi:SAM-dependent methyltransferase